MSAPPPASNRKSPLSGEEYLASLRDGRGIWLHAERVADPASHPALRNAARMVARLYDALHDAERRDDVVGEMYSVIQGQITRGVYISAHLRAGAVDIRSRDMSQKEKKSLAAAVTEVKGVSLLEESTPPHFHLQIN